MTYVWWKLVVFGALAVAGIAKAGSEIATRSRARTRVQSASREIADNTAVTLVGTVKVVGEPLIAPLSGTPCVYHRSSARLLSTRSRVVDLTANPEAVQSRMVPFVLVTRDGEVRVDAEDAETTLRPAAIVPRKLDREMAFLRMAGFEESPRSTGFDEIVITEGMRVAVHGVARIEIVPGEASFREAAQSVRLVGDERHPLIIDRA